MNKRRINWLPGRGRSTLSEMLILRGIQGLIAAPVRPAMGEV